MVQQQAVEKLQPAIQPKFLLHQKIPIPDGAADYQEDEYALLGKAIKYAGLPGKEVRVIEKSRSSLGEAGTIQ